MSEAIEPQTLSKKDLVDRVVDGDVTQHAFRTELCRTLTSDELKAYDAFLADSPKPDDSDLASFEEAMATFRQQEPARSGRPLNELMIPSGSPRSYIGLLLHYSPLPKTDMNLFDVSNPCVRILMTKGINEQTSFGWDMHWRAERTTGSGSPCPIRNYAAELKEMHDNMTKTVLERLALPWMLVGGKCAARGYKDLVKSRLRQVSVKIPGSDLTFRAGLEFALVDPASTSFGTGPRLAVHRVVAFMAHPEHVLHSRSQRNDYAASIAADPLINMILAGAKVPHTAQKAYLTGLVHAEADLPQSRPILLLPQSAQVGEAIPTQKHHTKFFNFQFCEKEEIALKRVLYPGEIESELLALVQQELGPSKYQRLLDSQQSLFLAIDR